MRDEKPQVVWVKPAGTPRRTAQVLRWLRWLLPAAVLIVAPAPAAPAERDDDVTIDADEPSSGPLSIADALVRRIRR